MHFFLDTNLTLTQTQFYFTINGILVQYSKQKVFKSMIHSKLSESIPLWNKNRNDITISKYIYISQYVCIRSVSIFHKIITFITATALAYKKRDILLLCKSKNMPQ